MTLTATDRATRFFHSEKVDEVTYGRLAMHTRDDRLRALLLNVSTMEQRHSEFWHAFIASRGGQAPTAKAHRARLWLWSWAPKIVNPLVIVAALELGESQAFKKYYRFLLDTTLSDDEKATLRTIIFDELEHEVAFRRQSETLGLSNVRDFVLGMNDGLVEILGTVVGLAAVYNAQPVVVGIGGLVVGLAGALSMGIGAYMSVRSQRQVDTGQRERMQILFAVAPERAAADFQEHLTTSGVPQDIAADVAAKMRNNREAVTEILAPTGTENETRSGIFTGLAYLLGVVFPVLPFFLTDHATTALLGAGALAGLALAATAALVSLLSGISLRRKVIEMVAASFIAAGISYGFGALLQTFFKIPL